MHASRILRRTLAPVLGPMHARRRRVLLHAVEALVAGRRLTLTDLARSWPGAIWIHAPLKALDRLLSNAHVHRAIPELHRAMAAWLLSGPRPLLIVDWSDLKRDGCWCLLRAAVPMGSRSLTVYERIYPAAQLNSPGAQADFLKHLATLLPAQAHPILVSDAGFRSDWFRAVADHGWDYIGRVRGNVKVRTADAGGWRPCADLFALATGKANDLGGHAIVQSHPLACRLVCVRKARQHRDQLTRKGSPQQGTVARKARKSAREPWLLATSLAASEFPPARIVTLYGKRMQIEQSFRDLKSHRFGVAFEDSLTRSQARLSVLLLLNTLASFAAWLLSLIFTSVCVQDDPMTAQHAHRTRYSPWRRAMEWLRRRCLPSPVAAQLKVLRAPVS